MTTRELQPHDFDEYFAAANGGHRPYDWQRKLCAFVIEHGAWPDRIDAPTGSGKSCIVDIHLFVNALAGGHELPALPRRLISIVGRRALVDAMERRAQRIAQAIDDAAPDSVLAAVRAGLERRSGLVGSTPAERRVVVTSLRGGIPLTYGWRDDPLVCQIVCATPDMWGSSALFRGYGSSDRARPRDAALLVYDTVAVLDEAHLNRQLAVTARRIAELTAAEPLATHVPALQFVEMTATHSSELEQATGAAPGTAMASTVALDWSVVGDSPPPGSLGALLSRPKPISIRTVPEWPLPRHGRQRSTGIESIVEAVIAERAGANGTVGCILNRVDDAIEVDRMLRKRGLTTACLVGRMREVELLRLQDAHPSLLTPAGDAGIDVLVATQTLEVGVDVDLHALVTELAPGTSLAQRAGRLNRLGARESGSLTVFVPADPESLKSNRAMKGGTAPYDPADLSAALEWLRGLAESRDGMSPLVLRTRPAPVASPLRLLYSRLEWSDADLFANTSESLFAEPDLTFWLRDELVEQPSVSIVARELPAPREGEGEGVQRVLAGGPTEAADLELLALTPPVGHELYPCTFKSATEFLEQFGEEPRAYAWDSATGTVRRFSGRLRPGDVIIVPAGEGTGVSGGTITTAGTDSSTDVMAADIGQEQLRYLLVRGRSTSSVQEALFEAFDELRAEFGNVTVETFGEAERTDAIDAVLQGLGLEVHPSVGLDAPAATSEPTQWLLITALRPGAAAETARETWTSASRPVLLDRHQRDVGERAHRFGERLNLPEPIRTALREAGELHDEGKRDPRFQTLLRNRPPRDDEPAIAKSPGSRGRALSRRAATALPFGWRHEQLSAAHVRARMEQPDSVHAGLVTRLVGTSHGVGRTTFPHSAIELLLPGSEGAVQLAAVELFDEGAWDELMERSHQEWGIWGCALLEAILRAADGQVSKEGK